MTADGTGLTSAPGTTVTVTIATTQPGGLLNPPFVDARRSALNTNDLRGKMLRIKVRSTGATRSRTGNLFDERRRLRSEKTRPEIYAMGFRNPFRIDLDENDDAYMTDYSPDSRVPENFRGPAGNGPSRGGAQAGQLRMAGLLLAGSPLLPVELRHHCAGSETPPQTFDCDDSSRGPANTSQAGTPGSTDGPPVSRTGDLVLVQRQQRRRRLSARRASRTTTAQGRRPVRSSSRSSARAAESARTGRRRTTSTGT